MAGRAIRCCALLRSFQDTCGHLLSLLQNCNFQNTHTVIGYPSTTSQYKYYLSNKREPFLGRVSIYHPTYPEPHTSNLLPLLFQEIQKLRIPLLHIPLLLSNMLYQRQATHSSSTEYKFIKDMCTIFFAMLTKP